MPPRTRKIDDDATSPTPAEAAAAEAGLIPPDDSVPEGMVKVSFRCTDFIVPGPQKSANSAKIRFSMASGNDGRLLHALLGPQESREFEVLLTDDDDFIEVLTEFFAAYGKATGQGNS
jgi:hypothetical protein